jgi:transcriptional regulator with XRE-family HTH domain
MSNFPKNLRYLRKKSGLKQEDMLGYLRITRSTWSNYEIGFTNPKLNEMINISKFFGVTLDELVIQDLEVDEPLPKKKGQRKAREYPIQEKISMVAEPDMIYVLKQLNRLRDEIKSIKGEEKEEEEDQG